MLCLCLKKTWFLSSHSHLQVNALGEWIVGIYLHEFTNNEQEISAECGIENFEFIVSERVQVNPDNSRATSVLTFLLFNWIIIEYTAQRNTTLKQLYTRYRQAMV